ncbi:DUF2065 domain-containing protein, partial [Roseateles sp. DXS20W]
SDWIWAALALLLVAEGLGPLLHPKGWREVFERMLTLSDGQLRFVGLCSVLVGLLLGALVWLH